MRNQLLAAVLGGEEFGAEQVPDIAVPETVEDIAVQAAVEVVNDVNDEVEEQGDQLEELADDVEDLQDKVEELQEAVEGAEGFLKAGQWNPAAFAIMYAQAERMHVKLGGEVTNVLGAESLEDATTAQLAAAAGLEGFGETAKKWGSQAVAFIKRIWDWLINFVKGLVNRNTALQTLASKVEAKINAKDAKPKEKLKLGKWNAYVNVEKSGTGANLGVLVNIIKSLAGIPTAAEALISKPTEFAGLKGALDKVGDELNKLGGLTTNLKKSDKNGTISMSGHLKGVTLTFGVFNGEVKSIEDVSKVAKALRLKASVGGGDVKTSGEIDNPINASSAASMVKYAKSALNDLKTAKVEDKFTAAGRERTIGLLKAADGKEAAGKAITAVKSAYAAMSALTSTTTRLGYDIAEGYLLAVRAAY